MRWCLIGSDSNLVFSCYPPPPSPPLCLLHVPQWNLNTVALKSQSSCIKYYCSLYKEKIKRQRGKEKEKVVQLTSILHYQQTLSFYNEELPFLISWSIKYTLLEPLITSLMVIFQNNLSFDSLWRLSEDLTAPPLPFMSLPPGPLLSHPALT